MEPVAYLDEDDTYVIAHCQQQFLEVLGLCRCFVSEYSARYLGQSVHYLCYLRPEDILYIVYCIVSVFDDIVQECGTDTCRAEPHLLACYLRDSQGVHDIWLSGEPSDAPVCMTSEVVCLCDNIHLPTVWGVDVAFQELLEGIVHHLVVVEVFNDFVCHI